MKKVMAIIALIGIMNATNIGYALEKYNGFGATPLMELYLIYELAAQFWQVRGVNITRSLVGNYTTSIDMAGCSITVTLMDEELLALWDAPVHTAALRWGC